MVSKNDKNIRKDLGSSLKKVRLEAGLTQADVASKADVHVNFYARIERGEVNPSFKKLHSITTVLGIKVLDMGSEKEKS